VEGGVIRAIGPELPTWRHLPAIDGSGTTLVPGLIDAHAHVRNLEDLSDALRFGVTTVLDLGASGVTPSQQSELRGWRSPHGRNRCGDGQRCCVALEPDCPWNQRLP
jgi:dihydroorotase-like cyclic amidohydrolase